MPEASHKIIDEANWFTQKYERNESAMAHEHSTKAQTHSTK
jgi:hypothetical protein